MAKIVKALGWAAPMALVAGAIWLPGLLGQDKDIGGVAVCDHGGAGGGPFRPDEALKNLRRMQAGLRAKMEESAAVPERLEGSKLPGCLIKSESEIGVEAPFADFTKLVFVDERTFDRVSGELGRGSYVLFVGLDSPAKAPKLNVQWGIAAKELIELFGVRCVPTIVVPAGVGAPSTSGGGKGAPKRKFKVVSVTRG